MSGESGVKRPEVLRLLVFIVGALSVISIGTHILMQQLIAGTLISSGVAAAGPRIAQLLSVQTWLQAAILGGLIALTAWFLLLPLIRAVERSEQALAEAREGLDHLRRHDTLTGLPERHYLDEMLEHNLATGLREGRAVGLLRLDLDQFRAANATLGHRRCNDILAAVAGRLREVLRGSDYIARYGGDEFCIVVPEVRTVEGLGHLADRVVTAVAEATAPTNPDALITCSIGIAVAWPGERLGADALLRRADEALGESKAEEGDHWHYHSSAIQGLSDRLSVLNRA